SYARFIAALERSGMIATRAEVMDEFPETNRVTERILSLLPEELAPHFNTRKRLIAGLVSGTLLLIDQEAPDDPRRAGLLFDNAIAMAAAGLCASAPG